MDLNNVLINNIRDDGLVIATASDEKGKPVNVVFNTNEAEGTIMWDGTLNRNDTPFIGEGFRIAIDCMGMEKSFVRGINRIRVISIPEGTAPPKPTSKTKTKTTAPKAAAVAAESVELPDTLDPVTVKGGKVYGVVLDAGTYHSLFDHAYKNDPMHADALIADLLSEQKDYERISKDIPIEFLIAELERRGQNMLQVAKDINDPVLHALAYSFSEHVELANSKQEKFAETVDEKKKK